MKTTQIKVICPGCNSCRSTANLIREVAMARQIAITLNEVNDPADIAALGITRTPAVMVNGEIVLAGGVPDWIEIENWLTHPQYRKTSS
jgi:predicted thioredoxin/glutaredoxin